MKKQRFFMLGIITVLVAVLSLTFVSSTFAKYTSSDSATDTARVAKWGINVAASGEDAFAMKYNNAADPAGTKVVSDVKVVAPGTEGTLGSLAITGKAEVMVDITVNFDLILTNWPTNNCPLIFNVGGEEVKFNGSTITTVSQLEQAVEDKVNELVQAAVGSGNDIAANTTLNLNLSVSWSWPFEGNDANDTELGNLATGANAPTIEVDWSATVVQVD